MGEANSEAIALITEITGLLPRYGETPGGEQCLHIGDALIVATGFALWGDPSAWQHEDGSLTVKWGGQVVRLSPSADGAWRADNRPHPLQGKARFVS